MAWLNQQNTENVNIGPYQLYLIAERVTPYSKNKNTTQNEIMWVKQ
jgi:hypothetical protein